ncbi:MAG: VOC family protein [Acidobacteriota bacterium]
MLPASGLLPSRVDHIGVVVPQLEPAMDAYIANLGFSFGVFEVDETTSRFSGSSSKFRIRIAFALVGLLTVELIQPVSGATLYSRYLEAHGPGIHHLGVNVDNLAKARKSLTARGYRSILNGSIQGLGKFSYFDAPDLHCIIEPLQLSLTLPLFLAANAKPYPQI